MSPSEDQIVMLFAYAKSDRDDLTKQQLARIESGRERGVRMKDEAFEELLTSVREAGAIRRGEREPSRRTVIGEPDVVAVRDKYGLSQEQFAAMIGISVRTLQNWEQGRRRPHGPARVLLRVAEEYPEAVLDTVRKAS